MKKLVAVMTTMALCSAPALSVELLKADFSGTPGAGAPSIPAADAQLTVHNNVLNDVFGIYGGTVGTTNWTYNATGDALLNEDLFTSSNYGNPTRMDLGLALATAGKTYTVTTIEVDVVATNATDVSIDLWYARDEEADVQVHTPAVVIPAGSTGTFSIDTALAHLIATDSGATWNQSKAANGDLRLGFFANDGLNVDSIEIGEVRVNGTVGDYVAPVAATNTMWSFNTLGDTEGWSQDVNAQIDGLDVLPAFSGTETVLSANAITGNDPQLVNYGLFAPAAGYWDSAIIRVRQLDTGGTPLTWDGSGCAVVLGDTIISQGIGGSGWDVSDGEAGEWITASIDISELGTNALDYVRFDPVGQASGTNKLFEVDYIELTSTATPPVPTLPENSHWEFNTDGVLEGWISGPTDDIDGLSVSNGVLFSEAITGGDPQLLGPAVSVGSYYWTTAEVRVRQLTSGGSPLAWDESGCNFIINGNLTLPALGSAGWDVTEEAGEWIVATLDISYLGSDDVGSIRIDPLGTPSATNKNFEVDYIRLNNQPTPVPPKTSWEFNADGDLEGWTQAANGYIDNLFVSNGVLSADGVTGNDPQLSKPGLLESQDFYWTTAQVRLRQLDTNGVPLVFSNAGMTSVIDGSVINSSKWSIENDGGEWVLITIGLAHIGNDDISGIRFDPVGDTTNKNFEVDYIRFNTSLAPLVQNLEHSWEFDTLGDTEGLNGNAAISGLTVDDAVSGSERVLTAADLTGNDSQVLLSGTAGIDAGGNSWDTLEIRARQLDGNPPGGSPQTWDAEGTIIIINGNNLGLIPGANTTTNQGANGWVVATVDISSLGAADINNFRLDVVGGPGSADENFEVDYIRAYSAAEPVGYDAWTYTYALSGGSAAFSADPDGDLFNNFYEYAFGGNPVDPMDIGLLPHGQAVDAGGTNVLEYIYYKRSDPDAAVDYALESKASLLFGGWGGLTEGVDYTVEGTGTYDAEMDAVTNHIPTVLDTEFFRTTAE